MLRLAKLQVFLCLFCLYFFGFFLNFVPVQAADSQLLISEINPFGSNNPTNCKTVDSNNRCSFDKWLEIHNPTSLPIDLKNWTLQFKNSPEANQNLTINQNILLRPGDFYLIAYKEVNYQSTLLSAGIPFGGLSGKMRNLSNKETGLIQVNLLNPEKIPVFKVNLEAKNYPEILKSNIRYSLEYHLSGWVLATNEFYPNNFGTPQNTVGNKNDLDAPPAEEVLVVMPKINNPPSNTIITESPTIVIEPVVEIIPEVINQPTTAVEVKNVQSKLEIISKQTETAESIQPALVENTPPVEPLTSIGHNLPIVAKETKQVEQITVSTTTATAHKAQQQLQKIFNQEALVFHAPSILPKAKTQLIQESPTDLTSVQTYSSMQSKYLWEYFFSYQSIGILAILFTISFALSQKDFIRQSFAVSFFENNYYLLEN